MILDITYINFIILNMRKIDLLILKIKKINILILSQKIKFININKRNKWFFYNCE